MPAAGVGKRLSLAAVTASCRGRMVFTKKSITGNLMVMRGCSVDTGYFLWWREEDYWSIDQFAIKENRTVQQNRDFRSIQKNYI